MMRRREYYASLPDNVSAGHSHGSHHSDSHCEDHDDSDKIRQTRDRRGDQDRDLRDEINSCSRRSGNHRSDNYDRKHDKK